MFQSRMEGSTGRKEISQRELRRRSRDSPGCAAPTGEGRAGPSYTQSNCAYRENQDWKDATLRLIIPVNCIVMGLRLMELTEFLAAIRHLVWFRRFCFGRAE